MNGITIVGSYNVGLFLKGSKLPDIGETVIADEFLESGGGKGSNQAVAASMLGAPVRLIARIGSDAYGRDALAMYDRLGIAADGIIVDETIHTGVSVILIDAAGNNLISVVPGANLRLSNQDLDHFDEVFRNSAIVGFQLENDRELVRYGLRKVHDMGIPTFLDPAPAVRLPDEMLRCVDYLKPNETEAGILTGMAVEDVESARNAARWLLDRGVGTAIVTLGAGGLVLATGTEVEHFPAPQVASVDSTGAGDVFSGGFLAGFAEGLPIAQSIRYGICAAALSTTRIGVIESIPSRAETIEFMDACSREGTDS